MKKLFELGSKVFSKVFFDLGPCEGIKQGPSSGIRPAMLAAMVFIRVAVAAAVVTAEVASTDSPNDRARQLAAETLLEMRPPPADAPPAESDKGGEKKDGKKAAKESDDPLNPKAQAKMRNERAKEYQSAVRAVVRTGR